jgi:CMP/dCMP kinase
MLPGRKTTTIKLGMRAQNPQWKDRPIVIAIDGPAASGKSTVARSLARRLGFAYVNSGAMYRAVTWDILRNGIDPRDHAAIDHYLSLAHIVCDLRDNESRIFIDGLDPSEHLRDNQVNESVSLVSSVPHVREVLVKKMRDYARENDLVMEGRDIGSVVFPDTPFKFYIDALPDVRSRRRAAEGYRDEIAMRDQTDSLRRSSPLVMAKDAQLLDTSKLRAEDVVAEIVARLQAKGLHVAGPSQPEGPLG